MPGAGSGFHGFPGGRRLVDGLDKRHGIAAFTAVDTRRGVFQDGFREIGDLAAVPFGLQAAEGIPRARAEFGLARQLGFDFGIDGFALGKLPELDGAVLGESAARAAVNFHAPEWPGQMAVLPRSRRRRR